MPAAIPCKAVPLEKGHDLSAFDCGAIPLNEYLRKYALQNHQNRSREPTSGCAATVSWILFACGGIRARDDVTGASPRGWESSGADFSSRASCRRSDGKRQRPGSIAFEGCATSVASGGDIVVVGPFSFIEGSKPLRPFTGKYGFESSTRQMSSIFT